VKKQTVDLALTGQCILPRFPRVLDAAVSAPMESMGPWVGSTAGALGAADEEGGRSVDALKAELDQLEKKNADAEEIPEEVDARLSETALDEFEDHPASTMRRRLRVPASSSASAATVLCTSNAARPHTEMSQLRQGRQATRVRPAVETGWPIRH
jgi:hypothetical protein